MPRERRLFTEGYGKMKLKAVSEIMLTLLFIGMLALAFNTQPVKAADWWPMFHHDQSHTGYSTSTAPNTNNTIWSYTAGWGVMISMFTVSTLQQERKYGTTQQVAGWSLLLLLPMVRSMWDHGIRRFTVWTLQQERTYGTTQQDGLVFSLLLLLMAKSMWGQMMTRFTVSTLQREYTTGNWVSSSPAVADGKVYVGSDDYKVYCLNASTGTKIWSYTIGHYVRSSPAVAYGKVYVGSTDDKVYCLNASTGTHIWSYTTGGNVYSSPAVADGKVYVGSIDDSVYCLDASSGAYVWSYTTLDSVESSPAVADGRVFIGSIDGKVYAFGPPSYTLTIYSSPTGVTFTADGVSHVTPWSGTFSEGASVSLVMPGSHDGFGWSYWLEDGDPNRMKTVTMDTNITLTGVYAAKPVGGKATPINIPMNKPETPALWIWLTTITLSLIATVVYIKRRKRNTETNS